MLSGPLLNFGEKKLKNICHIHVHVEKGLLGSLPNTKKCHVYLKIGKYVIKLFYKIFLLIIKGKL